jgi:hypothetical protein
VKRINPGKPIAFPIPLNVFDRLVRRSVEERTETARRSGIFTPCWRWQGYRDRQGYGQIKLAGKAQWITRVVFQLCKRRLREGEEVDHRCRTRDCWRPDHLRARPAQVNRADQRGPGSYAEVAA